MPPKKPNRTARSAAPAPPPEVPVERAPVTGPNGPATIADVARHADVAPMTVSRVLNGVGNVRESTRRRVQASIEALNYVPNLAARRLAGGEQIRIGVPYSAASAGYLSEFIVGLLEQSTRSHVQLVVEKCEGGPGEEAQVADLIDSGINGLILPPPLCDSKPVLQLVRSRRIPAVQVATGGLAEGCSAVGIDDEAAAARMTRHLLSLGHRRVGFIAGNPVQDASVKRLAGFRSAMAEAGLVADDRLIAQGMFTYRSGLDAAEQLLALDPRPTAVFAGNDDMAAATVAVAHRLGLDVPGDLTVVGCDDTSMATTIWPELTTIHQPVADMARQALEMLVRHVKALRNGEAVKGVQLLMDYSLIRRQSDAPPRVRPPLRLEVPATARRVLR